jgi:hypothetical protein
MPAVIDQTTLIAELVVRTGLSSINAVDSAGMLQMSVDRVNRDIINAGGFIGKEITLNSTTTSNVDSVTVPVGLTIIRSFELLSPYTTKLRPKPIQELIELNDNAQTGVPCWYALFGNTIVINPTPNAAYAYRMRYTALGDADFLCANFPALILYACLLEISDTARDIDSVARYAEAYSNVVNTVAKNFSNKRYGQSPPLLQTDQMRRFNINTGRH